MRVWLISFAAILVLLTIRFAYDSTNILGFIYIGEVDSAWSHGLQVDVLWTSGMTGTPVAGLDTGWAISMVTSFSYTARQTLTNCVVGRYVDGNVVWHAGNDGEVTVGSNEQSQGLAQIKSAILEIDRMIQNVASVAEESAAASEEVSSQSAEMRASSIDMRKIIHGR